jgi:hypothetical protein
MLVSFGKTVLWIMAVMFLVLWLQPRKLTPNYFALSVSSIVGAFAFGVGAALNGGCAVSTVTRLGNGELRMLLTIAGICVAIAAVDVGGFDLSSPLPYRSLPPFLLGSWTLTLLVIALSVWAILEMLTLWRGRSHEPRLTWRLLHHPWRLSTAAAVIALANIAIVLIAGHWAYTNTLRNLVSWRVTGHMAPLALHSTLFIALMAGVVCSSLLRRAFFLRYKPNLNWLRNLAGGILMGIGIVLVPGGNDGLLLDGIPSLSPHAIPAFFALLAGVTVILLTVPHLSDVKRIDCSGDICREN